MRLTDFKLEEKYGRNRISAQVHWEDCQEPEKEVFIETTSRFNLDINASHQAFLVGCLIPALHFGEKRIVLDEAVCPFLLEGLNVIQAIMVQWTGGLYKPLVIEAKRSATSIEKPGPMRSGMLFSGGIDSLAALRLNRLHYDSTHPGYVRDCILIHGFDIGGVVSRGMKYHVFDRAFTAIEAIADEADFVPIPVYTNIRHLCDERELWLNRFFGAVLAACAHALSSRIDLFYIGSSLDLGNLTPIGSHPLVDHEFSSLDLRIRHRDHELKRMEKLKIVADWDVGLQNLRVCLANVPDRLNCGKCEKCIRTMTGLVAINALDKTRAFVEDDVTPGMFEPFKINIRHRGPFYKELLPGLKEQRRYDLVDLIKRKLIEP